MVEDSKIKISKTKDYSKFKFLKGNRQLDRRNINTLIDSIKNNNLLSCNPIIVNSKMEVIDGQHRLEVCKKLKLEVYYVELDAKDTSLNSIINLQYSKRWVGEDYLQYYISQGRHNYILLRDFAETYNISLDTVLNVLYRNARGSGGAKKAFKEGTIETPNIKAGHEFMNALTIFMGPRNDFCKTRTFISAFKIMWSNPQFNLKQLQNKLEYQSSILKRCATKEQYLELLEYIYNYKSRETVFFSENRKL